MDGKRIYQISINGVQESINAVTSLNKQLDTLDSKIKELQKKDIKIESSSSGVDNSGLKEKIALQKELNQLKKEEAAQQRLTANEYENTMKGMKQQLADLKTVINATDLGDSESINKMTKDANGLTNKLKEMEQAYGQFGRNVGNYANGVAEGLSKIKVNVGGTVREFDNARQASRTLNNELKAMAVNGQQDTKAFKDLRQAVMQMESTMNDAKQPMDNLMDTMQSFVAITQVSKGFSAFFGFDNTAIERSIQKLVALQNAMQGLQTLAKQMQTMEGLGKLFNNSGIDNFVAKLTNAKVTADGLSKSTKAATYAVRGLSMALKAVKFYVIFEAISWAMSLFEKFGNSMDETKRKMGQLDEAANTLNKTFQEKRELLGASYLKGEMSDEEFLTKQYGLQNDYLSEQIALIRERISLVNSAKDNWFDNLLGSSMFSTASSYKGGKMKDTETIESFGFIGGKTLRNGLGDWVTNLIPTFKETVHSIQEVEEEFLKCQAAIRSNQDYFSMWGNGLSDYVASLFTTVDDTERMMRELGMIDVGNFVGQFEEIAEQFKKGEISTDEYAKKIGELRKQLNDNSVLRSVIVNLDKYIPDEAVKNAIQNIINEIVRLDEAFNMTSPEQVHHWNQVRIDGMKKGFAKTIAQLDEEERYEKEKYGATQEQIDLITKKYQRKREEARESEAKSRKSEYDKRSREEEAALKDLNSLRIQNMKEGLEKELAQLNEEKREKIQAVVNSGRLVGERRAEIEKLYDKKILDARKKWAYDIEQVYIDMWNRIYQINNANATMDFENQLDNLELQYKKLRDVASNRLGSDVVDYSNKDARVTPKKNNKSYKVEIESDESYTKRLEGEFNKRFAIRSQYYKDVEKLTIEELDKQYKIEQQKADNAMNNEIITIRNSYSAQDHMMEEQYKKGLITLEKYKEAKKRLEVEREDQIALIQQKYAAQQDQREREHLENVKKAQTDSYDSMVDEYSKFVGKLQGIDTSSVVVNGFGFTNIAATKRRNNQLIALYQRLGNDISTEIENLKKKLDRTDLTEQQRKNIEKAIERLNQLKGQVNSTTEGIEKDTEDAVYKLVNEINMCFQAFGQSLSQLMSSIWDAEDIAFDKEQEQIDKANEALDKALDKQQEIIEEHKSAIDSIEDELASARGDRRQHLIDQINAEIAAQRAAQKEEARIQKQKEAQERKQEELDKKRKKAEYDRNLMQIIVSNAMAAANGYATQPFLPVGLIMGSLAITLGAAQYAIAASAKPYKTGGILEGKSHKEGGIKVLGGRAEVEGGEFITNKITTQNNAELLYYVNSKKKRLDLDDMIDFYTSGKAKKVIMHPSRHFAEGGTLPLLNNNYDFDDRLITAFEKYAQRPSYVSVVDINSRQAAVKNVQVLAGLSE